VDTLLDRTRLGFIPIQVESVELQDVRVV